MKLFLMLSMLFFVTTTQASLFGLVNKIIKGSDGAVAASKAAAGAKGAAATGLVVNELDDAARATKLNLTHPLLSENETEKIIKNHYSWAPVRLAICITKGVKSTSNSSLVYCVEQYKKCLDERKINSENMSETCIAEVNKEYSYEKK